MKNRLISTFAWIAAAVGLAAGVTAAVAFHGHWLPEARRLAGIDRPAPSTPDEHGHDHGGKPCSHDHGHDHKGHDHSGHDHGESGHDHEHDEATALTLSKQAEGNIGLDLMKVELREFAKTISVPATIVQRPGRSQVRITAPFTGLVQRIYRIEGEAVRPGMPLFDLRLTHEELVEAQAEFLRYAEQLEVVKREVARLAKVAAEGAIAGKTLLERQYEQQKLEAVLHSHRQRLLLHRLTGEQVDAILEDRELLRDLTVHVPPAAGDSPGQRPVWQIGQLNVEKGQHVDVGAPLCVLADLSELYIEGKAFEHHISTLARAAKEGWHVTAVLQSHDNGRKMVENLDILYLANEVEKQSRAFYFYVSLPNEVVRDTQTAAGQRFVDWKYKPGQRLRLLVPTEPATQRIVLPIEAVVRDGAESYVFERNDDHFDQRSVRLEYYDQDRAVIANDGSLKLGTKVAVSGAYQIYLGTKAKDSDAVDPHAGHTH